MRLSELAERLGGRAVEGDGSIELSGVAALEEGGPEDLGFVRSPRHADRLAGSRVGALIAPEGVVAGDRPLLRSPQPSLDFARAAELLVPRRRPPPGVHPAAVIAADAQVDPGAWVGPGCVVGAASQVGARSILHANVSVGENVQVGADCELHPGVVVREGSRIGDRVSLQPGVVIGGDGFGYEFDEQGHFEKVPQLGHVVLEDDVEIGANSCVDRGRLGATRIGRGVKIDNLVQVGHNCVVGAHSALVAQVGLGGSTVLEERVFFMGQAAAAGHLRVGAGCFVAGRAAVVRDAPAGSRLWGNPAQPERGWHRSMAWFRRLPELARRLRALERRLGLPSRPDPQERKPRR